MRELRGVMPFVLIAPGAGGLVWALTRSLRADDRCTPRRKGTGIRRECRLAALAWQPLAPALSHPDDVKDSPKRFAWPSLCRMETKESRSADFPRNYRRAPERPFQIADEKGNVLMADKFQYG